MTDSLIFLFLQDSIDEEFNWPLAFFLVGSAVALFGAAAIAVWQIAATWRARMPVQQNEAYLELAADATEAQAATSTALANVATELKAVHERLNELERILRSVE